MEISSSQSDDLHQLLVDAKLAGGKQNSGTGYWFRSNEDAANVALDVLGDWLQKHVDPDQMIIQTALHWYNELVRVGHYSVGDRAKNHSPFRSDKFPAEVALAAAIERFVDSFHVGDGDAERPAVA